MEDTTKERAATAVCSYQLTFEGYGLHESEVRRASVLVVDDRPLMALGLKMALAERGWEVESTSGPSADVVVEHARRFQPTCTLLNMRFGPDGNRIDLIAPLAEMGTEVVVLTVERRRVGLAECLEAGATGWIHSSSSLSDVDAALTEVLEGRSIIGRTARAQLLDDLRVARSRELDTRAKFEQLSERESLVLAGLTDGLNAEEIAAENFVALTTVRSQIRAVLTKLDVRSQIAAAAAARPHRDLLPDRADGRPNRRQSRAPQSVASVDMAGSIA